MSEAAIPPPPQGLMDAAPTNGDHPDERRRSSRSRSRERRHKSRRSRHSRSRSGSRGRHRRRRSRSRSGSRSRRSRPRSREEDRRPPSPNFLHRGRGRPPTPPITDDLPDRGERTVFVSQLHPKVDERALFDFFSMIGMVTDIRLIRDSRTHKSKGLCYVEFAKKEDVHKAISLHGQLIGGFPISVAYSQAEKNVYVKKDEPPLRLKVTNLLEQLTDNDIHPIFEPFGAIESVDIVKDEATGRSTGTAYVTYRRRREGLEALNGLNGIDLAGRRMQVTEAESQPTHYVDSGPVSSLEMEDSGTINMTATSRLQLMQKLQRGSNMQQVVPAAPVAPSPQLVNVPKVQPTTCVILKNMFDPATESEPNWDEEIKLDVAEECSKYGRVRHIFVDKHSGGHVYLRFYDVPTAQTIINTFNGRWFASRQIHADFVPEATYDLKFPHSRQ